MEKKVIDWISIKDKLPENEKECLCFTSDRHYGIAYYNQRRKYWESTLDMDAEYVTHWMYLPDPPNSPQASAAL